MPGEWEQPLRWIDSRINELWKMRGPYPGLGAALTAFGVDHGNFVAYDIASVAEENEDPWSLVEQAFEDPTLLERGLEKRITRSLIKKWQRVLTDERRDLLKLLSRFNLSIDQAIRFYRTAAREEAGIAVSDTQLLNNPYLLYELDRFSEDPIAFGTVDRGIFSDTVIREAYALPGQSRIDEDPTDERRVRALIVSVLEGASSEGHTLKSQNQVMQAIESMALEPPCPVDEELMTLVEDMFSPVLNRIDMTDDKPAYQLSRLAEVGEIIRETVERHIDEPPHFLEAEWAALLESELGARPREQKEEEAEQRAREEKVEALKQLAASRVSVLIGPAGTGKTTLLSVLCETPEILNGGVTLLAPTGKARVQLEMSMQKGAGLRAQTIAQFLLPLDRYDVKTGAYRLSSRPPEPAGRTVIVDEASMLTEEQLAAVLQSLTGVERLILVGDPRQLPPIGSGRPFVDIVARLEPENIEGRFPRIGPGYAELTVRRRQTGQARDDLLLAEWFSGQAPGAGADEIWDRIESQTDSPTLKFVPWDDAGELHDRLLQSLVEELNLRDAHDSKGFEVSLGGSVYEVTGNVFFWPGRDEKAGAAAKVEAWQILSPVRGRPHGVGDLNRLVQRQFRGATREWAATNRRRIPKLFGAQEIVYGDKVINTVNRHRKDVYPEKNALGNALGYVANGEIGIVVGQFKRRSARYKGLPWKLEVEFSSQPSFSYGYKDSEFGEEADPKLELAYAITVHKSQGSEFGLTFLVLPRSKRELSPELLYTALTRQRERVVILHEGPLAELKRLASPGRSEIARRLTNLFNRPDPIEIEDQFLEDGLIHRTRRGDVVRSKSEVIIADLLLEKELHDYSYERKLVGKNNSVRYPDFTINAKGLTVYWEHLGMLHDPDYRERWEKKLAWYRDQDILPYEEGGGPAGTLVTSRDDERGGIDSGRLKQLVERVFDL